MLTRVNHLSSITLCGCLTSGICTDHSDLCLVRGQMRFEVSIVLEV
jgi:hypothetical protein